MVFLVSRGKCAPSEARKHQAKALEVWLQKRVNSNILDPIFEPWHARQLGKESMCTKEHAKCDSRHATFSSFQANLKFKFWSQNDQVIIPYIRHPCNLVSHLWINWISLTKCETIEFSWQCDTLLFRVLSWRLRSSSGVSTSHLSLVY